MKKSYLTTALACMVILCYGQNDSIKKLNFSAFGELYYNYDFSNPENHEISNFLYSHKRHNEINLNLLLLKANYVDKMYRANIGLMAGNYAQYNLSGEPNWAQFIYEANVGIKLSDKKNIWLDSGIMPSHIGFESAKSSDCWTLTRSIAAENSPYYETGLKLSYTTNNEKLYLATMLLNGWQRIRKPDFIQQPSMGFQLSYRPSSKLTINYSNFIGTDKPDSLHALRHFHNLYIQMELSSKMGIIAGFDTGYERMKFSKFKNWYSPVLIIRQKIGKQAAAAFRGEYYNDKEEVFISTVNKTGFRVLGLSSNLDFELNENIKWRIEGKLYKSKDKLFAKNKDFKNYYIAINLTCDI